MYKENGSLIDKRCEITLEKIIISKSARRKPNYSRKKLMSKRKLD